MVWEIISNDCLVFHWPLKNDLHPQDGEVTSESPNQTNPGFLPSSNWERQTRLCDDLQQRRAPQVFHLESRIPSPSEVPGFSSNICDINFSRHGVFESSWKLPETLRFRVTHENRTQFLWLSELLNWRVLPRLILDCSWDFEKWIQLVPIYCSFVPLFCHFVPK